MSRGYTDSGYEDEYSEARYNLWEANVRSATHGRRGQALLIRLRNALLKQKADLAYEFPEHMPYTLPRLIDNYLCNGNDVCSIGLLARESLPQQRWQAISERTSQARFEGCDESYFSEMAVDVAKELGFTKVLAWETVDFNDDPQGIHTHRWGRHWNPETPEERFERVLKHVELLIR